MSPPLCKACGVTACTQLENDNLQTVWQRESGYKWSWHSDLQAYWVLCLSCHRVAWPTDHRVRNRFSQPGWLYRSSRGSKGRVKLVSGDFYLTDPVPEFFRPRRCTVEAAVSEALPARRATESSDLSLAAVSFQRGVALESVSLGLGLGRGHLTVPGRSCLHGTRRCPLRRIPSLGRRAEQQKNNAWYLSGGVVRPMRRRERATQETIYQVPWMPPEERWPAPFVGLLPETCDVHGCQTRLLLECFCYGVTHM